MKKIKTTPKQISEIRKLSDEGVKPTAIANHLDIPLYTVKYYKYYEKSKARNMRYYFKNHDYMLKKMTQYRNKRKAK